MAVWKSSESGKTEGLRPAHDRLEARKQMEGTRNNVHREGSLLQERSQ